MSPLAWTTLPVEGQVTESGVWSSCNQPIQDVLMKMASTYLQALHSSQTPFTWPTVPGSGGNSPVCVRYSSEGAWNQEYKGTNHNKPHRTFIRMSPLLVRFKYKLDITLYLVKVCSDVVHKEICHDEILNVYKACMLAQSSF